MDIRYLITRHLSSGKTTLNDYVSKQILRHFQIPVIQEKIVHTPYEIIEKAEEIGYPVVIKAMVENVTDKTENDSVFLNVTSKEAAEKAAGTIFEREDDNFIGALVQPQVDGMREFIVGMFKDPQFGPVVLIGFGGPFSDAISDYRLGLAPLSDEDAERMINELQTSLILDEFHSEMPADRSTIAQTLVRVSHIAMSYPEITEIDINPLRITSEGKVLVLDASMTIEKLKKEPEIFPVMNGKVVHDLFYPSSVAFVGASPQIGKWGNTVVSNAMRGEYQGNLFFVNPNREVIYGKHVYENVNDAPYPIDLAVLTVPSNVVLQIIEDCKKKGIETIVIISSGFADAGEKGLALEKEIVRKAREYNIHIIGPNTIGIMNPHIQLTCMAATVFPEFGSTAVISQSGNIGLQFLLFAEKQGIGIRSFCGSGNEAMLTLEDFLAACEHDPLTQSIVIYAESVKKGRQFFYLAKRISRKKPIIFLRGGQTREGSQAAFTHTGSRSSDEDVFNALLKQAGVISVQHPMELLEAAAAFSSLPIPKGRRVAVMTLAGGWGVVTSDLLSQYGLLIPELPMSIIAEIDELLPDYWSRSNPVDLVGERDPFIPISVLETLIKWDGCDAIINLGVVGQKELALRTAKAIKHSDNDYSKDTVYSIATLLKEAEKNYIESVVHLMETHQKPIIGVSIVPDPKNRVVFPVNKGPYKGIFFDTPESAVRTLAKMVQYGCILHRKETP